MVHKHIHLGYTVVVQFVMYSKIFQRMSKNPWYFIRNHNTFLFGLPWYCHHASVQRLYSTVILYTTVHKFEKEKIFSHFERMDTTALKAHRGK